MITLAIVAALGFLARNYLVVSPYLATTAGDFGQYHESAQAVLQGHNPLPHLPYPPLVPLVMAPLGLLSLAAARQVWFLFGEAALLGSAVCAWKVAGSDTPALLAVGAVWCFGGTVTANLGTGQITPLLLLLLALALATLERRPLLAAALTGLAGGLKLWPAMGIAAFARRRRALVMGIAVALAALGLPLGVLAWVTRPSVAAPQAGIWAGTPAPLNFSVPASVLRMTYRWEGEIPPSDWQGVSADFKLGGFHRMVSVVSAAVVLGLGLIAVALGQKAGQAGAVATYCALITLALLASPISWYHYQVCQFPALSLLGAGLLRSRRYWCLAGWVLLATVLTESQHLLSFALAARLPAQLAMTTPGLLVALGGMLLFAWLLRLKAPPQGACDEENTRT
jgi:Glycosyltransferase family 87